MKYKMLSSFIGEVKERSYEFWEKNVTREEGLVEAKGRRWQIEGV